MPMAINLSSLRIKYKLKLKKKKKIIVNNLEILGIRRVTYILVLPILKLL